MPLTSALTRPKLLLVDDVRANLLLLAPWYRHSTILPT